ncbi:unnamed protein product [Rotaria sordida]|uniref:Mesoderm development candidate 2 n=1 Tax=Rotaria sordida TaxID=392033 RepID=A0A813RB40_9BILA|nr:unnamed protein product [Rotaria sordida]CAF0761026.1 unnamed protein product [Rotaria sordida]CAF0776605.1 unnamed protein product [Rotaria sordida]CAF0778969.1 unnamed protein product [Rotaria sordida]CAF0782323.1 unnamed protein product [Rotaria sordida]
MNSFYFLIICFILLYTFDNTNGHDDRPKREKTHLKKDPRDYTDRDADSLFEEWEDNDEDILPEDERDDYFFRSKNRPNIRPEDLVGKPQEEIMKLSKKGQTLMMFATVSGSPTRRETEQITQIWWSGLKNALYDVNRYVIDDNRILLVLSDGSQGFDVKDFLVQQDRCQEVTIDNKPYYGKGAKEEDKRKKKDL